MVKKFYNLAPTKVDYFEYWVEWIFLSLSVSAPILFGPVIMNPHYSNDREA